MEEIYFRDVVKFLWRSRFWVAGASALAVVISGVMYAHAIPQYEITMTLVPADTGRNPWEQQGATSLASQFLGVPVGDRRTQKAQQFLALFSSPAVLERAEKELRVLPHLFSGSWDPIRAEWIEPDGWATRIRKMLRADLPWVPPNVADVSKRFEKDLRVVSTNAGLLVQVTFRDRDPAFGINLLQALYRESDDMLRERARLQNDEHISYIQKALSSVSYAETRQSLTTLLTAEVGQRVMINSNAPYAMEILKPAFANPRPISPSLTLYTMVAFVLGSLLGLLASAVYSALRTGRRVQLGGANALHGHPVQTN
jgi:uncharacterized protein involved in exopolysaccharide biosynthesis